MDEELKDMTRETLGHVLKWVESAEGFVAEQAPLLCQEIVRWGIMSNALFGALLLAATVATLIATRFLWRKFRYDDDWDFEVAPICLVPLIASIFTGIGTLECAFGLAKVIIAPRLYLLEQLSGMM